MIFWSLIYDIKGGENAMVSPFSHVLMYDYIEAWPYKTKLHFSKRKAHPYGFLWLWSCMQKSIGLSYTRDQLEIIDNTLEY